MSEEKVAAFGEALRTLAAEYDVPRGKLRANYDAWCGVCSHWQYIGRFRPAARAKSMGWRLTRRHGWVCPDCSGSVGARPPGEGEGG